MTLKSTLKRPETYSNAYLIRRATAIDFTHAVAKTNPPLTLTKPNPNHNFEMCHLWIPDPLARYRRQTTRYENENERQNSSRSVGDSGETFK